MQVPEEPTLTVYFDIPTNNFSLNIQYTATDESAWSTPNLTKLLVDGISLPLSQNSHTFQEAGEHSVEYYIKGNTVENVFGYQDEGEVLPNPTYYVSKIILSKKAAISFSKGKELWETTRFLTGPYAGHHPEAGQVYFNGTKAEWEEIMSGISPYYLNKLKNQIDNFVHCTDGDITYE